MAAFERRVRRRWARISIIAVENIEVNLYQMISVSPVSFLIICTGLHIGWLVLQLCL